MEKSSLTKFIQKYYLSGLVESVKWEVSENKLNTSFVSDDSTVVGMVSMENFVCTDVVFGIYDTSKLNKLLTVLGDDISLDYQEVDHKPINLKMSDTSTKINYTLADLSVIPKVPSLKELPNFDVSVTLDENFISKFTKAKAALAEENTFTFECKDGDAHIVIGYSNINTNRVSIMVDADCTDSVEPISFSAVYLKEILNANKDAKSAKLLISTSGLAHVKFSFDGYSADYYLVKVNV